jgi:hypothetical protein
MDKNRFYVGIEATARIRGAITQFGRAPATKIMRVDIKSPTATVDRLSERLQSLGLTPLNAFEQNSAEKPRDRN